MSEPIQWFPGHMAQTLARLEERLRVVDLVLEVVDARLPRLSANPGLMRLAKRRLWLRVATRSDLASIEATKAWLAEGREHVAIAIDTKRRADLTRLKRVVETMLAPRRSGRLLVVGIPNSGKSTLINGLVGRSVARVENRAGVTRNLQWFRIAPHLEILDSPGVLMPRIADRQAQWMLALTGALPRERYDVEEVIAAFVAFCTAHAGHPTLPRTVPPPLATFAAQRGFRRHGDTLDLTNAALAYLKAFNEGLFGRYTFDVAGLASPVSLSLNESS